MTELFYVVANRRSDFRLSPPKPDDLQTLPSITIDVDLDQELEEIGRLALVALQLDWSETGTNYHFLTEPDSDGRRFQCPFSPYVDVDGMASWVPDQFAFGWGFYSLSRLQVSDVVRTRESGLFEGDSYAILLEEFWGAGGPVIGWDELLRFLAHTGEIYGGVEAVSKAAGALRSVVLRCRAEWEARHATPRTFFRFILTSPSWEYASLARLLGVSLGTTVELLEALGYRQDSENAMIYQLDPAAPEADFRLAVEKECYGGDARGQRQTFWDDQGRARS